MDTKPLERFATWARRELITAVEAQATAVLSAGSIARTERAATIKTLENEISSHGRENVIDKVAYTWFNRIIALRFMDARGYTDSGIVSPLQGQEHGQPEILADAKRGNLDTDVVTSTRTADAVIGLLDGTRRSTDAEGEAYALLLTEYCRHWHKSMPFMFERGGDYTELLVPANLLADGAILSRAVEVLTEDVCDDVEVIGWLYQFYISERKDEVFAGFKKNKKAGADEIPAATQLFTPHWIVRYLVENSLGRLWMLNRPTSGLVKRMDYYIAPVDEETNFLKITGPEDLTVIDPACGSGHMLTYAFDLLYAIYAEEGYSPSEIPGLILTHNLHGTEIDPRAGALAAFALTMKARAKQRTFFNKQVELKICVIEPISFGPDELDFLVTKDGDRHAEEDFWNQFEYADTLGALIQPDADMSARAASVLDALRDDGDILHGRTLEHARKVVAQAEALSRTYSVVTANPPYMGGKNMDARLASFAKENFPNTKSDLFAMFIERCLDFLRRDGYAGLMTPFVWMFISTYAPLRERLINQETITSLVQLEYSGFDGATVPICTYVLRRGGTNVRGSFVRLSEFVGPAVQGPKALEIIAADRAKQSGDPASGMERYLYRLAANEFAQIPGAPIAYWLADGMRAAFAKGRPLKEVALPRNGLSTSDNGQFLRFWWEVSRNRTSFDCLSVENAAQSHARWFPLNKGGEYRRWYGNQLHVVNWENDGKEVKQFIVDRYPYLNGNPGIKVRSTGSYFLPQVSWSSISSGAPAFREYPGGLIFDGAAKSLFPPTEIERRTLLGLLNSEVVTQLLTAIAPTLNFEVGQISQIPVLENANENVAGNVSELVASSKDDWDDFELSWDYRCLSLLGESFGRGPLHERHSARLAHLATVAREQQVRESENNRVVAEAYGLKEEVTINVPLHRVSLTRNVEFRYGPGKSAAEYEALERADLVAELISYAVGCMFGRYSLDEPGLILADQGAALQDYLAKVPSPTFRPDADNVIPFVDDGWFEDDIVERFRQFLRVAFGAGHFEENLRFVEESLGVKTLRDYFVTKAGKSKFYDDHVQRYKKRPIYWMFSSPKSSFNALIYLHRYTPSTVSTVLNEYLREYRGKLEVALSNAEREAAGGSAKAQKEADRLRKVLVELAEYEHDVLYPLATQQISIDLDDGVKENYPKLGKALKPIKGLEVAE